MKIDQEIFDALNEWFIREQDMGFSEEDIENDDIIHLAYTTAEDCDEEYELQVDFSLKEMCWLNYIDYELAFKEPKTKEQFINELKYCDFGDIICELEQKCRELHPEKEGE